MPTLPEARAALRRCRRIVLKVGSALVHARRDGPPPIYADLAGQIAALHAAGQAATLVSSGAIALGLRPLRLPRRPSSLSLLQAAASAGQPRLIRRWARALHPYGLGVGQVLLTHADLQQPSAAAQAKAVLQALWSRQLVPVINANDSIAIDELQASDNDQLAAAVAQCMGADLLVLLTTVDGLFDADPEEEPKARRVPSLTQAQLQAPLRNLRPDPGRAGLGTGGMAAKLQAADRAARLGIQVAILDGRRPAAVQRLLQGDDIGTLISP
jgi:glutamate 5-kinase